MICTVQEYFGGYRLCPAVVLGDFEGGMHGLLPRVDLPMNGLSVLAVGKTWRYFEPEKPWKVLKHIDRIESTLKI